MPDYSDLKNHPVSLAEVMRAREVVYRRLKPTALLPCAGLSTLLGASVYVKHENHNPTGAFKTGVVGERTVRSAPRADQRAPISAHSRDHVCARRRLGAQPASRARSTASKALITFEQMLKTRSRRVRRKM